MKKEKINQEINHDKKMANLCLTLLFIVSTIYLVILMVRFDNAREEQYQVYWQNLVANNYRTMYYDDNGKTLKVEYLDWLDDMKVSHVID